MKSEQYSLVERLAALLICKELLDKEIENVSSKICKHINTEYIGQGFRRCKDCDEII